MQLATPLSHIGNIKADTVKYLLTVREPGQSGGALRRGYRSLVGSFSGLCCSKRQKSVGRCLIGGGGVSQSPEGAFFCCHSVMGALQKPLATSHFWDRPGREEEDEDRQRCCPATESCVSARCVSCTAQLPTSLGHLLLIAGAVFLRNASAFSLCGVLFKKYFRRTPKSSCSPPKPPSSQTTASHSLNPANSRLFILFCRPRTNPRTKFRCLPR